MKTLAKPKSLVKLNVSVRSPRIK